MYKILFVDDEENILNITEMLMSSMGVEVILANSGEKATEILLQHKEGDIDVVFLDLTMPKMNGLDVLKWLNKQKITIPVILQTGIEGKDALGQAIALGAKDCLIKPYTKEQLHQLIVKHSQKVMADEI